MVTRIRCFYDDCVYNDKGICSSSSIELDPEDGCLTYTEDNAGEEFLFESDDAEDFEDDDDWEEEGFEEVDEEDLENEDEEM
jgi:hypothetical protein